MRPIIFALALLSSLLVADPIYIDDGAVEKFIPTQNPIQDNSFFRVASYNANFFASLNDPATALYYLGIDLYQIRVFVLVIQEFPKTFTKGPYYSMVKTMLQQYGMPYVCECFLGDNAHTYGTIIASRYPLKDCQAFSLGTDSLVGRAAVQYNGRWITLLGSHEERQEDASAQRLANMNNLVDYVISEGLDQGYTLIAIDTTQQFQSDSIWALRSGLPIDDVFYMLGWTRPSYTSYQGITRNYIFMLRGMKTMPVGCYVLQGQSDSFAAIVDMWKYPDEVKLDGGFLSRHRLGAQLFPMPFNV